MCIIVKVKIRRKEERNLQSVDSDQMFKTAKETAMFTPNESSNAMMNNGELGGQVRATGPPP